MYTSCSSQLSLACTRDFSETLASSTSKIVRFSSRHLWPSRFLWIPRSVLGPTYRSQTLGTVFASLSVPGFHQIRQPLRRSPQAVELNMTRALHGLKRVADMTDKMFRGASQFSLPNTCSCLLGLKQTIECCLKITIWRTGKNYAVSTAS